MALRNAEKNSAPLWPLDMKEPIYQYLLEVLAQPSCALCTDIDGTISLTAPTVDAAVLLPGMRELLLEATHYFEVVATISGRGIDDQRRMIDIPAVWHVGHHGYEWEGYNKQQKRRKILYPRVRPYIAKIAKALDEIEVELTPLIPGLWMERKGVTGGIHWRLAEDHKSAETIAQPIIERIANRYGLRWRGGKMAIELFPPIATNKGEGLGRLIRTHHIKSVIYLGDDVSDTDAFFEIHKLREQKECLGISIGVLHHDAPQILKDGADILTNGTESVANLISWIISKRMSILKTNTSS